MLLPKGKGNTKGALGSREEDPLQERSKENTQDDAATGASKMIPERQAAEPGVNIAAPLNEPRCVRLHWKKVVVL